MPRSEVPRSSKPSKPKPGSALPAIPDKLYFRIGEVARLLDLPPYVLRFWESEFPQLKPNKGGTGQRLYRRRDVEAVAEIRHLLYDEGYTIPGARQLLKERRGRAPLCPNCRCLSKTTKPTGVGRHNCGAYSPSCARSPACSSRRRPALGGPTRYIAACTCRPGEKRWRSHRRSSPCRRQRRNKPLRPPTLLAEPIAKSLWDRPSTCERWAALRRSAAERRYSLPHDIP